MATLSLRFLGDVQILHNGVAVTGFVTRKAQALFFYLAATQIQHPRDKIANLFWPEMPEQNARNNLRRILPNLRQILGEHLTIDHHTIAFNRHAPYELDIVRFTEQLAMSQADGDLTPSALATLEEKASLYRGDFMQDFHLSGAPDFEEWMLIERENLRQQSIRLLTRLADHYLQSGNTEAGLAKTRRLLELEPWHETAHYQQMLLLAQSGQRMAALAQYETCRNFLAAEFGVEPSTTMTEKFQRIKDHGVGLPQIEKITLPITGADSPLQEIMTPSVCSAALTVDLSDMPRPTTFYGRQKELATLTDWLTLEQTTLVGLLGTGGAGKTMLAAELARKFSKVTSASLATNDFVPPFTHIIWRSLINAPSLSSILKAWLQILANQPQDRLPTVVSEQIDLLFIHLREKRCLLILDNLESLLEVGTQAGIFRAEFVDYEYFFRRMGETEHRSCLLFTSRELPLIISRLERSYPMVRSYPVRGLDAENGVRLLKVEGINGTLGELVDLVERYSGNPLALKLVAETVQDLFGGDVEMLLQDRTLVFDDIRTVLEQQMKRLSPLEIEILCWLAIERAPTTLQDLAKNWVQPPARPQFLDAVRSLQRRGLLEHAVDPLLYSFDSADLTIRFVLQNVVMEFISEFLIERFYQELVADNSFAQPTDLPLHQSLWLNRFGLVKAQSRAAVRDVQKRLLLQPLLRRLLGHWGTIAIVNHLRQWLNNLRGYKVIAHGYAGANLFHLLLQLNVSLDGWDFSYLPMRQAELQTYAGFAINLQGADLSDATFINTIGIIPTLAISPDGRLLAAGSSDGAIYLWRTVGYQLERVLPLHTQSVRSVRFSHDGTLLASGGLDGLLCLWSVQRGAILSMQPSQGKSIITVAFSRDDHCVAVATSDEMIHIWDCQRGKVINSFAVSTTITDIAISPDGQWLVCVGAERLIKLWNLERGELHGTLCGHEDKILAVTFDPQSERIATGGEDGHICLWNIATLTVERTLIGHTELVLALAFDPVGPYLASNSADQTTRIWHAESGQLLHVLRGHRGWVQGLAFAPTRHRLFTGGYDQTIRLWELKTGTQQHLLQGYHNRVDFLRFSHNGALLAASGLDGTVYLWHVASASLRHKLVGAKAAVRGLAFNHKNTVLATASDDGSVCLWDITTGQVRATLSGHTALVRNVNFSLDDRYLISGSHDRTIAIWDLTTGERQRTIPNVIAISHFAVSCHPVRPHIAYGTYEHQLIVLNLENGQIVHTIDIAPLTLSTVAYSPDGQLLACGAQDGHLLVFDLTATDFATPIHRVHATEMPIWSTYFSPDGLWLAWVCAGQEIHRLELNTGRVSESIRSYFGAFCLAFDRQSQHVFTDGIDNSVLVRSVTTGRVLKHLYGHKGGVTSIEVHPFDDLIASSSADGSIRLWNPTTEECVAVLQAPGPYASMDITDAGGISQAQRQSLIELGAVDQNDHNPR